METDHEQQVAISNELNLDEGQKTNPTDVDATDAAIRRQYIRFNFVHYTEISANKLRSDNHEKRLQNIRKELVGIKNTEWQFDPIEKYIGQL